MKPSFTLEQKQERIKDLRALAKLLQMFKNSKGGRDLTEDQVDLLSETLMETAKMLEESL